MPRNISKEKLKSKGYSKKQIKEILQKSSNPQISDVQFDEWLKLQPKLSGREKDDSWKDRLIGQIAFVIIGVAIAVPLRMCTTCESDKSGWKYHDKNGNKQIQYQGSQEQQRDLDEIDRYFGD